MQQVFKNFYKLFILFIYLLIIVFFVTPQGLYAEEHQGPWRANLEPEVAQSAPDVEQ